MAEKQPSTGKQVPDPATHYDRSDPRREAGAGRVTTNDHATPAACQDKMPGAVHNAQDTTRQLNAEDEAEMHKADRSPLESEPGWENKPLKGV